MRGQEDFSSFFLRKNVLVSEKSSIFAASFEGVGKYPSGANAGTQLDFGLESFLSETIKRSRKLFLWLFFIQSRRHSYALEFRIYEHQGKECFWIKIVLALSNLRLMLSAPIRKERLQNTHTSLLFTLYCKRKIKEKLEQQINLNAPEGGRQNNENKNRRAQKLNNLNA